MRVIGTAGHVDHGKSTLVEALTGTHPDRLKEEQARQMTIDLGFAWLPLPEGAQLPDTTEIGIVDVPGHRDFIENMLAGVGGIDAALFVVAADEGVMPQTREHLAILDLLQIHGGVVALTKIDLVPDPEWLDLVEEELRIALQGTVLDGAPVIRVSGKTGQGLEALVDALVQGLSRRAPRPDLGRPRLPIDRVFSISGFGTVVTGTLSDGQFQVGDEVVILPPGVRGRVRGLQSHQRKTAVVQPGGRTAINISGVTTADLKRGDVVAHPGAYRPTRRLDARFRLLNDVDVPLKHNVEVKLFIGAAEAVARVRLLGKERLAPGDEGWLQIELREPVVAVRGDRYILRRPSPPMTLGGGAVIDPHPARRYKRFSRGVIERLEALYQGSPAEILHQSALTLGAVPLRELLLHTGVEFKHLEKVLDEAIQQGELLALETGPVEQGSEILVTAAHNWERMAAQIKTTLREYHQRNPLRAGMSKEELRSRLRHSPRVLNAALRKLIAAGEIVESGPLIAQARHEIRFSPDQKQQVDQVLARFDHDPFAPPTVKEVVASLGEAGYQALVELQILVPVSAEVVFRKQEYERMTAAVRRLLADGGTITVAEMRDQFKTSRRYVLAFLEHLDEIGVTVREGDTRRLK